MKRFRRPARIGAWAMLAVAAASLLLAGIGVIGVSWSGKRGEGADVSRGAMFVRYRGAQGRFWGAQPGWRLGPADRQIALSGPGGGLFSMGEHQSWLGAVHILRGGLMPAGGPPVVPGPVIGVYVRVQLLPVAGVAAALGGVLWFVSRRRLRPGACAACGYDLSGLAPETACPECGAQPIAQHQGNGPGAVSRTESSPGLSMPPLMPRNPGSL